jgi:hypothetical protein
MSRASEQLRDVAMVMKEGTVVVDKLATASVGAG